MVVLRGLTIKRSLTEKKACHRRLLSNSLVACQTEQWRGVRATKDFDCQEQLEREEIEKRFRDKKVRDRGVLIIQGCATEQLVSKYGRITRTKTENTSSH